MRTTRPLAACGGNAAQPASQSATASSQPAPASSVPLPANPVTVLRQTGATPDPGEKHGHAGLENDQLAHGVFPGGEEVTVFTYDTAADRAYWAAHPVLPPQDGETDILGPDISLIIVNAASLTSAGGPSPQQIAAWVQGTVLP